MAGLVRARWTDAILDEVFEHLKEHRPDLDSARLDRTPILMNTAIRDVLVHGYEPRIARLTLSDPDDRHVLAAAIQARASVIVTSNTKDFPAPVLERHAIVAQRPDDFLPELCESDAPKVHAVIDDIAHLERPRGRRTRQPRRLCATDSGETRLALTDDRPDRTCPLLANRGQPRPGDVVHMLCKVPDMTMALTVSRQSHIRRVSERGLEPPRPIKGTSTSS